MGPIGKLTKVADAISAIAFCRSSGANSTGITDSDSGKMAAAPIPSTALAVINSPVLAAYAHAAELAPNKISATSSTFLRPSRSPSRPAGSIAAARTRLYASEIHCRSLVEACRSVAIVGSARLSTVRSSPTTSTLAAIATSAHHLRAEFSAMTFTPLRELHPFESNYQKYSSLTWQCQPQSCPALRQHPRPAPPPSPGAGPMEHRAGYHRPDGTSCRSAAPFRWACRVGRCGCARRDAT